MWAIFTLIAAAAQTARNATQRGLIGKIGSVGATQVRFLFGLPFSLLFLAGVEAAVQLPLPARNARSLAFVGIGALAQIAATALMLSAMRRQSFVVVVAFTKTEAAQVALFALVFLGEKPTGLLIASIALATLGVFLLAAKIDVGRATAGASAAGLVSAAFFAIAALSFRQAVLALAAPSYVLASTLVLVEALFLQTVILFGWLAAFDRALMRSIVGHWRGSLTAGFMGALASQFWFLAFALSPASRVRTLALVEVLFAQAVSSRVLKERFGARELIGIALIVVGAILIVNS